MIKITDYRGFEISFCEKKETFTALSGVLDIYDEKKSFSACKKWVDEFLKDNQPFKPFRFEPNPLDGWQKKNGFVLGIRKDNRFIVEINGKKEQLSEYNEKDYIVYNPDNEKILDEINKMEALIEAARLEHNNKIKELKSKLIIKTLKDFKNELGRP